MSEATLRICDVCSPEEGEAGSSPPELRRAQDVCILCDKDICRDHMKCRTFEGINFGHLCPQCFLKLKEASADLISIEQVVAIQKAVKTARLEIATILKKVLKLEIAPILKRALKIESSFLHGGEGQKKGGDTE